MDEAFADQVERVLAVRARFNPADESWGELLLRELPAGTQTTTGKTVGPRFVPVDGCHRIALLRHHGRKILPAGTYRLVGDRQSARDNTAILVPKLRLTEAEYLDYLAMGFDEDTRLVRGLVAGVAAHHPERSAELESVIASTSRCCWVRIRGSGKQLMAELSRAPLPTLVSKAVGRTVGRLTARWRTVPDYLIIGTKRGGTTSLQQYLTAHPDVLEPKAAKASHYFDANFSKGWSWYRAHFPLQRWMDGERAAGRPVVVGEASPYYCFHPLALDRIAARVPDVKLIIVLRDPVERAWSHYSYEVARGNEDLSFADALDAEPARTAGAADRIRRGEIGDDRHWRLHTTSSGASARSRSRPRTISSLRTSCRWSSRGAVRAAARRHEPGVRLPRRGPRRRRPLRGGQRQQEERAGPDGARAPGDLLRAAQPTAVRALGPGPAVDRSGGHGALSAVLGTRNVAFTTLRGLDDDGGAHTGGS